MPLLNDTTVLFTIPIGSGIVVSQIYLFSFGLGITWASMMAMPYEMLAFHTKGKQSIYGQIPNMLLLFHYHSDSVILSISLGGKTHQHH